MINVSKPHYSAKENKLKKKTAPAPFFFHFIVSRAIYNNRDIIRENAKIIISLSEIRNTRAFVTYTLMKDLVAAKRNSLSRCAICSTIDSFLFRFYTTGGKAADPF